MKSRRNFDRKFGANRKNLRRSRTFLLTLAGFLLVTGLFLLRAAPPNVRAMLQSRQAEQSDVVSLRARVDEQREAQPATEQQLSPLGGSLGVTAFGVTANGTLFRFRTDQVSTVTTIGNLGIVPNAIDFLPGSTQLYAIVVGPTTTQLYTVNISTATVTPVGAGFPSFSEGPTPYDLTEGSIGFDFNPRTLQADNSMRIRVVSSGGTNLRINSSTGNIAAIDSPLQYADGDENEGQTPFVDGVAYTNSAVATAAAGGTTVLYDMDFGTDVLATQIPPNSGTLNTVGEFGVAVNALSGIGFDIFSATTTDETNDDDFGFAVFQTPEVGDVADAKQAPDGVNPGPYLLYDVNLDTGTVTNGRLVGGGLDFTGGFAVLPIAEGLNLVKLTNGTDNNTAPGPVVPVGSTVTFTYVVTVSGITSINNVTVSDDNGTPGNMADDFNATFVGGDANMNNMLDPGETWTFTAGRIATAGQYTNTATVTGFFQNTETQVSDTDVDNHFGGNPNITISIDDVSQAEGNTGAGTFTPFVFTVSLSAMSAQTITVDYQTANGTAYAAEDYLPAAGTLTFNPGDLSNQITVFVNAETLEIADETFFVNLSNPTNATIADGQGQGTIINDDVATPDEPFPPHAFAITNSNQLLSFNVADPGVILSRVPITGLVNGEAVIGIDFRPATGQLYGFTGYNRLVTINTATGAATVVAQLSTGLLGSEYGVDFNPTVDRLRIVNDNDQNASVDPTNGTVTLQTPLNPGNPNITGVAYSNNFAGAVSTTLYAIDSATDTLYTQNPPASGTLAPIGPLGVDTGAQVGFDISPISAIGYASLTRILDNAASLYAINLATGQALLIGQIGGEPTVIRDITISTIASPTVFGVTPGNNLVTFNSLTPENVSAPLPITGLISGEAVIAIDFRPATGQLFGYTGYNRLVTIDTTTGAATVLSNPASLVANEYGFDFNPTVDRIRLVNDSDNNLRLNPDTGALAGMDTPLAYAPGDPNFGQNPSVTGAAYTNNFAGSTSTTLYDIDANRDVLVTQGSPGGSPTSPNTGQLFTVGSLGFDTSNVVGFDVAAGTGAAYATLQPFFGGFSRLYAINLLTGRATLIGQVGGVEAIRGIAVAPAGTFQFTSGATAVAENAGTVTLTVSRTGDTALTYAAVSFETVAGTATAPGDYTATTGTVFFLPGETSKNFTVPITDDLTAEVAETFTVRLIGATSGYFNGATNTITVTINDND